MSRLLALNNPDGVDLDDSPVDPDHAGTLLVLAKTAKTIDLDGGVAQNDTAKTDALKNLARQGGRLVHFDPLGQLTDRDQALAFWINLYNAMVIHGALTFGTGQRITDIPHFFKRTLYQVGRQFYDLNVIEHGLLRANRGHPLRFGLPQLMPWDARRKLIVQPFDVRIHFALNCGAVSCPPIRSYTARNIDRELDIAAGSFIGGGGVNVDPQTGQVLLSRIFLWYARDFGWTKRRQLAQAMTYMADPQKLAVADAARNGIAYADYDWSFA